LLTDSIDSQTGSYCDDIAVKATSTATESVKSALFIELAKSLMLQAFKIRTAARTLFNLFNFMLIYIFWHTPEMPGPSVSPNVGI
jgi:hypothetical protein